MNRNCDDLTILDPDGLWRRIHPLHIDRTDSVIRITSAAFKDPEMSVVIESEARKAGRAEGDVMAGYEKYGLASVTARLARQLEQIIVKDPVPEEPAHGLVIGNKSRSVAREFAKQAVWLCSVPE